MTTECAHEWRPSVHACPCHGVHVVTTCPLCGVQSKRDQHPAGATQVCPTGCGAPAAWELIDDDDDVSYVCPAHLRDAIHIVLAANPGGECRIQPHPWSEARAQLQAAYFDRTS